MKAFIILLAFVLSAKGVTPLYRIDWWTIDAGGGTSTNDVYSISGTIGQPDTSAMSGGNYSLQGGVWSMVVVQTAGAPTLAIRYTSTNTVIVQWPSPSTGWNLQQNTDLASTNWSTVVSGLVDDGTNKSLIVNPPSGNRFYRLASP